MSGNVDDDTNSKDTLPSENSEDKKSNAESHERPSDNLNRETSENISYEGDTCIYTDPESKYQYVWDSKKDEWVPRNENPQHGNDTPLVSNTVNPNDYKFDGENYVYVDKQSGVSYKYNTSTKKWIEQSNNSQPRSTKTKKDEECESDSDDDSKKDSVKRQDMSSGKYSFDGDNHLYTDPNDGTVYLWDKEKNAWFPKVDEDFLAHYQMNYGFIDNKDSGNLDKPDDEKADGNLKKLSDNEDSEDQESELKRKAAPKEPEWFDVDDEHNTKVYVSNLPLDITEEEFVNLMQKCGLVMKDLDSGRMKVKLYTEPGSKILKGDALCTYIKVESVELALKLIDGSELRGKKLKVERAKFQMKGEKYDPNLKPRKRRKKDKEKMKKIQEKLFDWRPDKLRGERSKNERVVIVKNVFEPSIFDNDVALILEYQQDLREECSKCGDVRKVVIYDRNPEGVAQITFREAEEADECIKLLDGRWFGQRKLTAETWDGKTKYKIIESEEETQKRLQQWTQYLEAEDKKKAKIEGEKKTENSANVSNVVKSDLQQNNNKNINEETTCKGKNEDQDS